MTETQQADFDKELTALCKRYSIAMFAGFFVSSYVDGAYSGVTVAAPWAKPTKSTNAFVERVTWRLTDILSKETPMPAAIEYHT